MAQTIVVPLDGSELGKARWRGERYSRGREDAR